MEEVRLPSVTTRTPDQMIETLNKTFNESATFQSLTHGGAYIVSVVCNLLGRYMKQHTDMQEANKELQQKLPGKPRLLE